jgi:hypothetical protein
MDNNPKYDLWLSLAKEGLYSKTYKEFEGQYGSPKGIEELETKIKTKVPNYFKGDDADAKLELFTTLKKKEPLQQDAPSGGGKSPKPQEISNEPTGQPNAPTGGGVFGRLNQLGSMMPPQEEGNGLISNINKVGQIMPEGKPKQFEVPSGSDMLGMAPMQKLPTPKAPYTDVNAPYSLGSTVDGTMPQRVDFIIDDYGNTKKQFGETLGPVTNDVIEQEWDKHQQKIADSHKRIGVTDFVNSLKLPPNIDREDIFMGDPLQGGGEMGVKVNQFLNDTRNFAYNVVTEGGQNEQVPKDKDGQDLYSKKELEGYVNDYLNHLKYTSQGEESNDYLKLSGKFYYNSINQNRNKKGEEIFNDTGASIIQDAINFHQKKLGYDIAKYQEQGEESPYIKQKLQTKITEFDKIYNNASVGDITKWIDKKKQDPSITIPYEKAYNLLTKKVSEQQLMDAYSEWNYKNGLGAPQFVSDLGKGIFNGILDAGRKTLELPTVFNNKEGYGWEDDLMGKTLSSLDAWSMKGTSKEFVTKGKNGELDFSISGIPMQLGRTFTDLALQMQSGSAFTKIGKPTKWLGGLITNDPAIMASTFLLTYGDTYKETVDKFRQAGIENANIKAHGYALVSSYLEGLLEGIGGIESDLIRKNFKPTMSAKYFELLSKGVTEKEALMKAGVEGLKTMGGEILEENLQGGKDKVLANVVNMLSDKKPMGNVGNFLDPKELIDTAVFTALATLPLAIMGGAGHYRQMKQDNKEALLYAANNYNEFKKFMDVQVQQKSITKEKFDAINKQVQDFQLAKGALPQGLTEGKQSALIPLFVERKLLVEFAKQQEGGEDNPIYKGRLKEIDKEVLDIYNAPDEQFEPKGQEEAPTEQQQTTTNNETEINKEQPDGQMGGQQDGQKDGQEVQTERGQPEGQKDGQEGRNENDGQEEVVTDVEEVAKKHPLNKNEKESALLSGEPEEDVISIRAFFKNPITDKYIPSPFSDEAKSIFDAGEKSIEETSLSIDELIPTQHFVEKGNLLNLKGDTLPLIVKIDGDLLVFDGHHRISAKKLKGEQRVKVRLLDIDKVKKDGSNPELVKAVEPLLSKEQPAPTQVAPNVIPEDSKDYIDTVIADGADTAKDSKEQGLTLDEAWMEYNRVHNPTNELFEGIVPPNEQEALEDAIKQEFGRKYGFEQEQPMSKTEVKKDIEGVQQGVQNEAIKSSWESNIEALVSPKTGLGEITKKTFAEQQPFKDAFLQSIGLSIEDYRGLSEIEKGEVQSQWVKSKEFESLSTQLAEVKAPEIKVVPDVETGAPKEREAKKEPKKVKESPQKEEDTFAKNYGVSFDDLANEYNTRPESEKRFDIDNYYTRLSGKEILKEDKDAFYRALLEEASRKGVRFKQGKIWYEGEVTITPKKSPAPKKGSIETLARNVGKKDVGRGFEMGVFIDDGNLVATDANHLVVIKDTEDTHAKDNGKVLNVSKEYRVGQELDQKYPMYKEIIPKDNKYVSEKIDIKELLDFVNGANFSKGNALASLITIPFEYNGNTIYVSTIVLEPTLKTLQDFGATDVVLELPDAPSRPIVIKDANSENIGLVMPMVFNEGVPQLYTQPFEIPIAEERQTKEPKKPKASKMVDLFGNPSSPFAQGLAKLHETLAKAFPNVKLNIPTTEKEFYEMLNEVDGASKMVRVDGREVMVRPIYADVVDGFYSNTENALGQITQGKMSGNQWGTQLLSRGANKEEMKWTGLEGFLKENAAKSITKEEIQQFLKDNRIEIVEVVKADLRSISDSPEEMFKNGELILEKKPNDGRSYVYPFNVVTNYGKFVQEVKSYEDAINNSTVKNEARAINKRNGNIGITKFSRYQLEGEKSGYKEVLVIIPRRLPSDVEKIKNEKAVSNYNTIVNEENAFLEKLDGMPTAEQRAIHEDISKRKEAAKNELPKDAQIVNHGFASIAESLYKRDEFQSSHFDEPNILVHLRMNTRVDSDGNKVLFLEEVQSDFGQSYKKDADSLVDFINKNEEKVIEAYKKIGKLRVEC